MFSAVFAAAAVSMASAAPPLDLRLICPGQYQDTETATAQTQKYVDGEWRSSTTQLRTPITRTGNLRLSISGDAGELVYPDGRTRTIKLVEANPAHLIAEYEMKGLIRRFTWRIDVDRMTGDVRVASGNEEAFRGVCSPEPSQPKF